MNGEEKKGIRLFNGVEIEWDGDGVYAYHEGFRRMMKVHGMVAAYLLLKQGTQLIAIEFRDTQEKRS